jgi:pimeloyl-ACP methyl ester carboxylesterase
MGLHAERYGSGEKIIFIHGAGGSTRSWYFQKEYLKGTAEVILLDLPGHGRSKGVACESIEECAEAVLGTIRALNLEKCYLAGHSMGGAIAMTLALTHPEVPAGLILVGTGAKLRVFPEILEGLLKDKEGTVRKIVDTAFSLRAPASVKDTAYDQMMECEKEVIYRNFYACDRFNAVGRLGAIEMPVQIICGMEDLLTPPKYSEFLQKEIKGSTLELVEGGGHLVMLEKPDEVNRLIEGFVKSR